MSLATILQQSGRDIVQAAPQTPVGDVVRLLADRRIGAVPVVEQGQVIGIMSERDVIHAIRRHGPAILDWPVERVMTRPPITIDSSISPLVSL